MTTPRAAWDVAVVGAGPAGAVAALLLARRGFSVLVLERARFPREKVCGDTLISDSLRVLDALGLAERVEAVSRAADDLRIYAPSQRAVELKTRLRFVRRAVFDECLMDAAREAGAELQEGVSVESLQADAEGVRIECREGDARRTVAARVALIATGAVSPLLDGLASGSGRAYTAIALRAYFTSKDSDYARRFVVSFDRQITPGYGWIAPLPNGEFNVGCGVFLKPGAPATNLKTLFDRFVHGCAYAKDFVRSATRVTALRGAPLRCGMGSLLPARERVVAIGESQGVTFPLSGEGIGKAMETGVIAAQVVGDALHEDDLSERRLRAYTERLAAELLPRQVLYARAQGFVSRPYLANLLAWRASKSAYVRSVIERVLDETLTPDQLFLASTVLRSFVG